MSTYKKIELLNPLVEDEVLHPTTTADLVKFADGTTLDSARTSVEVNITLSTTWDVGTGSYTQTFSNADLTENSIIDLRVADNATDAQIDAFNALDLIDGGQTNGSFTIPNLYPLFDYYNLYNHNRHPYIPTVPSCVKIVCIPVQKTITITQNAYQDSGNIRVTIMVV